jgi:hypothetical protein
MNFDGDGPGTPDRLEISELAASLAAAQDELSVRFDLVAFDECAMAMAEIAQALAGHTDVFVASQEAIPGAGFDYETALATLENDPAGATAAAIAQGMVASYQSSAAGSSSAGSRPQATRNTLSVARMDQLGGLLEALSGFVDAVLEAADSFAEEQWAIVREARDDAVSFFGQDDYRDLGQFMASLAEAPQLCSKDGACGELPDEVPLAAGAVISALGSVVIDQTTTDLGATGLSIFFPRPGSQRLGSFPRPVLSLGEYGSKYAAFHEARWGEFLAEFVLHEPDRGKDGRDPFETNNSLVQASDLARALADGRFSIHRTNDQDWYRFVLGGVGLDENFVAARNTTSSGEIRLSLYNTSGGLLRANQLANAEVRLDLSGVAAGTYYAVVDSPRRAIFRYTMSMDTDVTDRGSEGSYELDLITENQVVRGLNVADGLPDFINFRAPRQESARLPTARVTVDNKGQMLRTELTQLLPDGSTEPVQSSNPFEYQYSASDGASYQLVVQCEHDCVLDYDVSFVVQPVGVAILPDDGSISITESGSTGEIMLFLTSRPFDNVTVSPAASPQIRLSTDSLSFTPSNWNEPQPITVTAIDDNVFAGHQQAQITYASSSTDPNYDGLSIPPTNVSVIDDVPPAIVEMVLQRDTRGKKITAIHLTFSEPVQGADAATDYLVATNSLKPVAIASVTYDSELRTSMIRLRKGIAVKKASRYSIRVEAGNITDLVGHSLTDFVRPLDQEGLIAAAIDELLAGGRLRRASLMAELRHQDSDGELNRHG